MTPARIEIHPQAIREARAARRWYAQRSIAATIRFVAELDHAVAQITTRPQSWPPHLLGTRVYRLRRFPYLLVYRELGDGIQIIAIAHGKKRPGYWKRRLP